MSHSVLSQRVLAVKLLQRHGTNAGLRTHERSTGRILKTSQH